MSMLLMSISIHLICIFLFCLLKLFFGPSRVRALPLAACINEGGHYFCPSGVRALPLAAGINVGGHYF